MEQCDGNSAKRLVWEYCRGLDSCSAEDMERQLSAWFAEDSRWEIFHPFNTCDGLSQAVESFWKPLKRAVPDMERRVDILTGSSFNGSDWVTVMGHFCGNFEEAWLGIEPTEKLLFFRIGEFHRIEKGKIAESHILLDIPDVMRQAGCYPLPPMPAAPGIYPPPKGQDGIRLGFGDSTGYDTLSTVLNMHKALHDFDGENLDSMKHGEFWSEHFHYYAPAGIGSMRGMRDFRRYHQQPFLISFPDRYGKEHYCRINDGPIAATTHWGTLRATHLGSEWLEIPATGKKLTMRVADWYYADHEGRLIENWLFMDIPHIFSQLGEDILQCEESGSLICRDD